MRQRLLVLVALVAVALPGLVISGPMPRQAQPVEQAVHPSERWRPAIEAFAELDAQSPPATGGILFLGSSSIRLWDLGEWFADLPTLNRGFGGSQISDSLYFFDRLVRPYAPRTLVFYAGDNDIAAGKTPERVARDFATLVARIEHELPDCRIIFVAIKPSLRRWHLVQRMREANRRISVLADGRANVQYLDIDTPMIGPDGMPRKELFVEDGLHLDVAGYDLWSRQLAPLLRQPPTSDSKSPR